MYRFFRIYFKDYPFCTQDFWYKTLQHLRDYSAGEADFMGWKLQYIMATGVYHTILEENLPYSFKEIEAIMEGDVFLHRYMQKFEVNHYIPIRERIKGYLSRYMEVFTEKLHLNTQGKTEIYQKIYRLYRKYEAKAVLFGSISPLTISATLIYLAFRAKNQPLTQGEVADAFLIPKISIRNIRRKFTQLCL